MLGTVWADFKTWAAQPFRADMPLQHWFLFIGMLLVILVLWRILFMHIEEGLN